MAKKKNNNGGEKNNNSNKDGGEKKAGGDGGEKKKEDNPITVVLKVDMHCEGCATKIVKCLKSFDGVESVKSESVASKLTVVGKVDPLKLAEKLAERTKKKVDLVSPLPKKENKDKGDADDAKKKPEKTDDNKKPKEAPVTTAVFKLNVHCQGCVQKIKKIVSKTKGFHDMSIDRPKDLVTVKGTMDMKELAENLKEKLKRPVDIVPPKKEKEKEKEKGDNGDGGGGGDKKKREEEGGGGKMEGHKMEYPAGQPGFGQVPYGMMVYGPGYPGYGAHGYQAPLPPPYTGNPLHAPQMFSDENPNACTIM